MTGTIDDETLSEYVLGLLDDEQARNIAAMIRRDPDLARREGEWINVFGSMAKIEWDGPVPDVYGEIKAKLFGRADTVGPSYVGEKRSKTGFVLSILTVKAIVIWWLIHYLR